MLIDLTYVLFLSLCGAEGVTLSQNDYETICRITCDNPIVSDDARDYVISNRGQHDRYCVILSQLLRMTSNNNDIVNILITIEGMHPKSDRFRHIVNKIMSSRNDSSIIIRACVHAIGAMHNVGDDYSSNLLSIIANSKSEDDIKSRCLVNLLKCGTVHSDVIAKYCDLMLYCKSEYDLMEIISLLSGKKVRLDNKNISFILSLTEDRRNYIRVSAYIYKYRSNVWNIANLRQSIINDIDKLREPVDIALYLAVLAALSETVIDEKNADDCIRKLGAKERSHLVQLGSFLHDKKIQTHLARTFVRLNDRKMTQYALEVLSRCPPPN